jgi:BASS family bile acid:Na+ symporter
MPWLKPPAAVLSLIGRHGTLIAAGSIVLGLAAPPLAALLKPALGPMIVLMLILAFLRVDPAELRRQWTAPKLVLATMSWNMLVAPLALGLVFVAFGLQRSAPGLYFIMVLQMSAPGLMSAPAIAALLGLDVALTLASLIATVAVTPVTASLFTHAFLGTALADPVAFGVRLFLIIAGSALAAALLRRWAGAALIERQRERIDGLSVLAFGSFAVATMDGVSAHFAAEPKLAAALTLLTFLLSLGMTALTALVFLPAGRGRAFAIGLTAGNRNIGLMLAATGFHAPDVAWLYFALAQLPIYLMPQLLKPLTRRLTEKA